MRSNIYVINKETSKQSNPKDFRRSKIPRIKTGAAGILETVLDMCNTGKTVEDIKNFCEKSLNMDGMKN